MKLTEEFYQSVIRLLGLINYEIEQMEKTKITNINEKKTLIDSLYKISSMILRFNQIKNQQIKDNKIISDEDKKIISYYISKYKDKNPQIS